MRMQRLWLAFVVTCVAVTWAGVAAADPNGVVAPTAHNFGNVHVGTTVQTTVTVSNQAQANPDDLDVTNITTSGSGCAQFDVNPKNFVVNNDDNGMPPFPSQALTVTFTPSSAGAQGPCTFTLVSNNVATLSFQASGTGTSAIMSTSTTALDFGNEHIGGADPQLTFTVSNGAGASEPLDISMVLSGVNPADYSVGASLDPIPAGMMSTITVTFDPGARLARDATLTISGNDAGNTSDVVTLTGVGTSPNQVISNASLNFGNVHAGSMAQLTFTVSNPAPANEDLTFTSSVTLLGTEYFVVDPADTTLAPGDPAVTVTVNFVPLFRNARNGTITITGNDSVLGNDTVSLTGNGTSGALTETWTGAPAALNCGSVKVSSGTTTCTITVQNLSPANEAMTIGASVTTGGTDFAVTNISTTSIGIGSTSTVTITFDPTTGGTRNGVVTITSNDFFNASDTVNITGTGTTAVVVLPASPFAFGNTHVNTNNDQTVVVDNSGTATLTVSSMTITGTNANQFSFTDHGCSGQTCNLGAPFTVTAGADFENVVIRCTPTTTGSKTATLTVLGDQESGTNTMTMTCNGTSPTASITPPSHSFGNVRIGQNGTTMLTVANTSSGATSENLDYTISKSGADAAFFTVSPLCGNPGQCDVPAGMSDSITVTFTPTARRAYSANIVFTTDDPANPTVTIAVTGTGVAPVLGNAMPASLTHPFANTDVGTTSAPATLSVQNTGDAILNVSSVVLVGAQANQFRIATGMVGAHTVNAGSTDTWTVVCEPTSFGAKAATFRINSDAFGSSSFDFSLTCTGEQAVFSFSPPAGLNFGQVPVGMSSTLPVTISNNGNQNGAIPSIVSGNGVYTFTTVGGPTVAPATSMTVNVTFTPVNGSVISSQLTVMTDGPPTSSPASFTIPLVGDGTTMGIDVSVVAEADLDVTLGDLRVATTATRTVQISNEGDTPFMLNAPTSSSGRCTFAVFSPALPATIPGGGTASFNVNVTPNVLGGDSCMLTVASSLPSTDTINVSWNGVAPGIELLNPANGQPLDFTGVDVDAAPQTIAVQVRNSGTDVLTISNCVVSGSARFTVQTCPNITVPSGQTTEIDVTFDPNVQADELGLLTLTSDAFMAPTAQVTLQGVGVDQNMIVPTTAYTFPDTFRNPDEPSVIEILVQNPANEVTEEGAPVTISMVTSSDDPVFEVGTPGPLTIDPDGELRVPVSFSPTSYTPFTGTITIMNDTTGLEMAEVDVSGLGISRYVMVGPGECDLGVTGVGVPVTLTELIESNCPDGIAITNIDPDGTAYTVREFALLEAGAPSDAPFEIIGPDPGAELAGGQTLSYDVVFTPTEADDFDVELAVYLDGDPQDHARVTLHGRAVEVDVHGGGCQASGGGAGWLGLSGIGLGAMLLRRRRRKLAGKLTVGVAVAVAAVATSASADPTRNIEVSTFSPTPATEVDGFEIESPRVGVPGAWALGISLSHATNLIVVGTDDPEFATMTDTPLSARTAFELGFAYAFAGKFEAGLRLPFYSQTGTDPQFSGLTRADGTAFGDVIAHAKMALVQGDAIGLAGSVDITAPTATEGQFAGTDGPTGHLRGIAGWRSNRMSLTANAGFLGRGAGELGNISQGNALTFGAGASFRALESMWVIGEAFGQSGMGSPSPSGVRNLEGALGIRYEIGGSIGVSAGVGRGLMHGVGSPDLRGFFLLDVAPRARKPAPLVVEKPRPPRDTRDDDGDGLANADDTCPADAEDLDEYGDQDGCPDPDNDEDGLLDGVDQCPIEAEDKDGTADDDGCIDADDDGDGIKDVDDKCPKEPEDGDGYMDSDGCDEPDNDSDGIPDVIDQCALEPETINGNGDDDGCPDSGDSLVMVMPDRIEIFEPITFQGQTATLTKKSHNVLGQVAATMRANRDFKRVRVTVHVHPRGGGDQELSDKRAKVVRDWLIQWGIEPERIDSRGLGSTRTLVPKTQKGAAAVNDRVEFIILEKDVK